MLFNLNSKKTSYLHRLLVNTLRLRLLPSSQGRSRTSPKTTSFKKYFDKMITVIILEKQHIHICIVDKKFIWENRNDSPR